MPIFNLQDKNGLQQGYHYEVDSSLAPLGMGGMGQVMRGERVDEKTGVRRPVAIKFLYDDLPDNVIERAKKEASIQIQSENLVEMLGFLQVEDKSNGSVIIRNHVVSELLHGVRLLDLLEGRVTDNENEPIAYAQELFELYKKDRDMFAVQIIKSVLSGLMALHDKGYIHRDVDPSNVMITSDRKIKLIDFGVVKSSSTKNSLYENHLTNIGTFIGKANYAAPELISGEIERQNWTTDIYAVGIMLFQLLVGHLPFRGTTQAELMGKQLNEKVPVEEITNKRLADIVARATEKKQEDRYQSAAEFRAAIDKIHTPMQKTGKKKSRKQDVLEPEQKDNQKPAPSPIPTETSIQVEDISETDTYNYGEHPAVIENYDNIEIETSDEKISLIKEIALWAGVALGGFGLGALIQFLL